MHVPTPNRYSSSRESMWTCVFASRRLTVILLAPADGLTRLSSAKPEASPVYLVRLSESCCLLSLHPVEPDEAYLACLFYREAGNLPRFHFIPVEWYKLNSSSCLWS
ncbi:hypothetical protein NDU88_008912 [Pleurodeles waltl]|uniref:Uncharacterized protein n=1 Tax=Pleurodeles waltl TaxID=8319 RepID=A0AAV7RW61_PLEWA|nr:hypothetical protein NDU88_008912 [Pleurodeles waltl]